MTRIPSATYRVQLTKDFQFKHARALLPYLRTLGISDLYASPIFQARTGSTHGYDVTDPSRLNAELGAAQDFDDLVRDLKASGMGLLLDIVPNHMAANPENPWWMDVLENGPSSAYSSFFDVEWGHGPPDARQKIYLPALGEPYGKALEEQKLRLSLEPGGFRVSYYALKLPLDPSTYYDVLSYRLEDLLRHVDGSYPGLDEFGRLLEMVERLPARSVSEWEGIEARHRDIPGIKRQLWDVYSRFQQLREFIDENLGIYNGADLLDKLLDKQPYQLAYWKVAREKINYRRFFDVSELIGIRAQDPHVFEATHAFALRLLAEGKITSLRVDHIDGLYDPLAYLAHLHDQASNAITALTNDHSKPNRSEPNPSEPNPSEPNRSQTEPRPKGAVPVYVIVEKILSGPETLPEEWPVSGTTGYDFLGIINNYFVHPRGLEELRNIYNRYTGNSSIFSEVAYSQKKRVLQDLFAGEVNGLGFRLSLLAEQDRHARDLSPREMQDALIEVTASLPVYRTYTRDFNIRPADRGFIQDALSNARMRTPEINPGCFDFLERVLLLNLLGNEDALRFVMRWQQLTGPVMAKGVEDTTLYQYVPLISMNEVGGNPSATSIDRFHAFNRHRQRHWPDTMNASSTHDTKRSEDVRARINVLSEMPGQWEKHLKRWTRWNRDKKKYLDGSPAPDANDEYLLYQTLLGAWPLHSQEEPEFRTRLKNYIGKAVRESKRHSSWLQPNSEYEQAFSEFADAILEDNESNQFLAHFLRFQNRIAFYGAVNSLSQTLLKICCPGIPDFYEGATLWDFSLVDPDNRRPPQVPARLEFLEQAGLLECWRDGRVKSFLIYKALQFRKEHPELFRRGDYIALEGSGLAAEHTVSFARKNGDAWALIVAPRFVSEFSNLEKMPLGPRGWKDAAIPLPDGASKSWIDILTGQRVTARENVILVADALRSFPAALLFARTDSA